MHMDKLTEDLFVVEILSRLPIKSLISVKYVCRPWRSMYKVIISNPTFVKLHKLHNPDNNHNDSFIAHCFPENGSQCHKLSVINTNFRKRPPINLNLPFPTSTKGGGFNVVGSCNGLLCLAYMSRKKPRNSLYLWNPATGQLKDIHNYKINIKFDNCDVSLGFGFDHASTDYKVVRIVRDRRKGFPSDVSRVEVYSLNKNVWKEIDVKLKFEVPVESFCVCVKGVFYWLTEDDHGFSLVSFNVQSEEFRTILLPIGIMVLPNIFILKESLAIAVNHYPDVDTMTIWTRDDYRRDWIKMHTLKGSEMIKDIVGGLDTGEFIGETLLGELFLYDPLNDKVKACSTPRTYNYGPQLPKFNIRIHKYSASLEIV